MMEHDKVSVPRTAAAGAGGKAGGGLPTSPEVRPPTTTMAHEAPPSEDVAMEEVKVGAPSPPRAARSPLQERRQERSSPGTANTQRTKDATTSSKRADASPSQAPKKAKQQRRHDRDEQGAKDELDSALDALQEVSSAKWSRILRSHR